MGEILPLRSQWVAKHLELKALMIQPDADLEAIQTKQKEVIALRTQIQEKAMAHQLEFRQTLSPEQIQTWGAWRATAPAALVAVGLAIPGKAAPTWAWVRVPGSRRAWAETAGVGNEKRGED